MQPGGAVQVGIQHRVIQTAYMRGEVHGSGDIIQLSLSLFEQDRRSSFNSYRPGSCQYEPLEMQGPAGSRTELNQHV